jgi:hypothetical protein
MGIYSQIESLTGHVTQRDSIASIGAPRYVYTTPAKPTGLVSATAETCAWRRLAIHAHRAVSLLFVYLTVSFLIVPCVRVRRPARIHA